LRTDFVEKDGSASLRHHRGLERQADRFAALVHLQLSDRRSGGFIGFEARRACP